MSMGAPLLIDCIWRDAYIWWGVHNGMYVFVVVVHTVYGVCVLFRFLTVKAFIFCQIYRWIQTQIWLVLSPPMDQSERMSVCRTPYIDQRLNPSESCKTFLAFFYLFILHLAIKNTAKKDERKVRLEKINVAVLMRVVHRAKIECNTEFHREGFFNLEWANTVKIHER